MDSAAVSSKIIYQRARQKVSISSLESAVGNTPLIELRSITRYLPNNVQVFAKAEFLNPGGSVKDRAALAMILDGEKSGKLTQQKTILDATSGNTGIAYAMLGAVRGYKVMLVVPSNASIARKRILKLYGAEIIESDPLNGTDAAQLLAKKLAAKNPDKYFYPDQYNNPANWRAHFDSTALEIWGQTQGKVSHFVAGLGTTGTFIGTSRRLKQLIPKLQAISVQPISPLHGLEGMKHLPTALVPGIYDSTVADENLEVSTEDAQAMTRRLAREEGLFVGVSSGANVHAAINIAEQTHEPATIVTILCDGGGKYLEGKFWVNSKC
jgi:cysteine synthase B